MQANALGRKERRYMIPNEIYREKALEDAQRLLEEENQRTLEEEQMAYLEKLVKKGHKSEIRKDERRQKS